MSKYLSCKLLALTNSLHVSIAAEELKRRKLLEARLAIEAAEAAAQKMKEEAVRVAEENRVRLEAEKAKKAEDAGRRTFDHLMIKVATLFIYPYQTFFITLFTNPLFCGS